MNTNSNTIENNNCDKCGNNKEPTGECFDCVIRPSMVECGICYNLTQSPSRGFYCDHQVCGDCSNQITTCPFCRRPWDEEEEDDEEEDDAEEEVERSQDFNRIRSLREEYQTASSRMLLVAEETPLRNANEATRDAYEAYLVATERYLAIIQHQIDFERNSTLYQVRANDNQDPQSDNEGEWQFTTEEHARDIYTDVMDDIAEGVREEIYNLRITRTPLLDEEEWNELFGMEGLPYPGIVTIEEWVRPQ